jgi:NAD(P)-dependent dehydrogenase (short-subunit alcohol dehydrogenase family)
LNSQTALVTGGTAGIGFHTAVGLARAGARVFVTGRNEPRGRQAIMEMRGLAGHDAIELLVADTSSVRANGWLAEEVSGRVGHLDILVNNAGRVILSRTETPEGFEATLALNFIGPFALTTHLLPLLSRAPAARVVNVVSSAFEMWTRDPFEDLEHRQSYVAIEAHARAKLLNLLFTLAMARRLAGSCAVAAVNPGMAWTPGVAALTREAVPHWRFIWPVVRWIQRRASAEAAAAAPLLLASSPALAHVSGRYFNGVKEKRLPGRVTDATTQDRAWALGESLVARVLAADARTT